ncbi:hypothetical protein QR77_32215 [Streptomyces sp. 150FB]|nr:hypothetical protein QR77_32215 [Streptomyces sp. 150FB]
MGKSDSHDGLSALSDAPAGLVVMILVLLCPYATYKFVHWASGGGHDLHRSGIAGLTVAAGAAKTAGSVADGQRSDHRDDREQVEGPHDLLEDRKQNLGAFRRARFR